MRQAGIWFWMSCKRYLHRISFLIILLLLPFAAYFIRGLETREGTEIRIAVCIGQEEDKSETGSAAGAEMPLEQALLNDLVSDTDTDRLFRFYACGSEEEVKEEVASRRAECGYVIASGLREKLDAKNFKRSIRVYSAPSTVAAELTTEVVFAALIRRYDRELFLQYLESGEAFAALREEIPAEQLLEDGSGRYDAWMKDGGTFHFVYDRSAAGSDGVGDDRSAAGADGVGADRSTAGADGAVYGREEEKAGDRLFPVRGMVSVYVFVVGLYGAAVSLMDEKKGLYQALSAHSRFPCQLASILGPVVLAAVSGLAALASGGSLTGMGREAVIMAGYAGAVTGFSWLLRQVCRRDAVVCSLIPFFLIGSMIFCPVIVDVGRYLPALGMAGRWFLPWYYLRLF